jgi:hypothetical protein
MKDLTGKGNPFHSALDKAATLLKRKVGTGAEFMQELKALGGVKQAEIDERKLAEVLGMPKMTHEQFVAELGKRPVPAIQEKVLSKPNDEDLIKLTQEKLRQQAYKELLDEGYTQNQAKARLEDRLSELQDSHAQEDASKSAYWDLSKNQPHHETYTLPGGENYREMLIKAPGFSKSKELKNLEYALSMATWPESREKLQKQIEDLKAEKGNTPDVFPGVGAHFGGEGGILASMRLKDRMTPEGQKLLHLEELQSDWHQQGREKGYKGSFTKENEKRFNDLYLRHMNGMQLNPEEVQELQRLNEVRDASISGVPDAPFKKNWEEVALKRLLHHAADKGYHGVVVTPGEEQADRYNLAKQVDRIAYNPNSGYLQVTKEGKPLYGNHINAKPDELHEYIGKELADKLLSSPELGGGMRQLQGDEMKVGGEGMKAFYDKKVPNILNAIGKKHGVKTQLHGYKLPHPEADLPAINEANAIRAQHGHPPVHQATLHHFPITEDMRKDILTNGLPLYADGGIIRKAEGGNVQLSVEQMRQQLMNAGKGLPDISQIGAQEAPNMPVKSFVSTGGQDGQMPVGGVDMNPQQPGQQLLPASMMQPQPQAPQQGAPAGQAPQGGSNILQMTPQGQKMAALSGSPQGNLPQAPQPPQMAMGGSVPMPYNNHPFQLASQKPIPFMAKVGGSDNMPMDNQSMDNGATTFDIDNIQELAMGGGVQGYASKGYVHHTDINPHPKAGKRFVSEQLPGLMPEYPVNMDQLYNEKASLQLRPWDSTSRHVKVSNVSGHDLLNYLITEGGQGFARDEALNKEGISGASGREIQGRIQSRANAAHEENIKQGGHGHTYDIVANMDKVAPLFTHMPLHIQMDLLKQRELNPNQMEHIENRVRSRKVQGKTPFTNLLPLNHPESMKQLMEIGALRKAVSEELASKTNQKLLDYNLEDLLSAVTDPHIHAAPAGYAGNTFIANVPHAGLGPKRHSVYDTSGYGEYAGKGAQVPAELYMADTFERVSKELQKQFPKAGASAIRAMTIGALQTRGSNVSQMVNDRVMKNLERYHEGVKQGDIQNPNDLYGVLGHFYKKYGGYKEGGNVKKTKVADNLDTMRLALTRNKKAK